MDEQEIIDRVGYDNAVILINRYNQYVTGLEMASEVSCERTETWGVGAITNSTPRERGDIPGCIPVNAVPHITFLDKMKQIEEDFMSGKRKREVCAICEDSCNASEQLAGCCPNCYQRVKHLIHPEN